MPAACRAGGGFLPWPARIASVCSGINWPVPALTTHRAVPAIAHSSPLRHDLGGLVGIRLGVSSTVILSPNVHVMSRSVCIIPGVEVPRFPSIRRSRAPAGWGFPVARGARGSRYGRKAPDLRSGSHVCRCSGGTAMASCGRVGIAPFPHALGIAMRKGVPFTDLLTLVALAIGVEDLLILVQTIPVVVTTRGAL